MRKYVKKAACIMLSAAMVFTSGGIENSGIKLPWDFSWKVSAAKTISESDSTEVTSSIVKDTVLLNALKNIVGGGSNITVGQLKSYTGAIDLSNYTGIKSLVGLGYARNASSFDLSKLTSVNEIPKEEFYNCQMTEVKLPDSIQSIGESAFRGCDKLETINLPNAITYIYDSAFLECEKLENVNKTGGLVLPNALIKLGTLSFSSCASLKSVVIPNTLTTSATANDETINVMGTGVFSDCTSLTSVTFGSAMTMVPASTFASCSSLETITIPTNFTEIGASAFSRTGLTSLDLSSCTNLTTIGNNAFEASSLVSISLPDSLTKINQYTFANCKRLSNVVVTNNSKITEIGAYAFQSNYSFYDVTFMGKLSKLKTIGDGVFYGSSEAVDEKDPYGDKYYLGGPENVVIPGGVTSIGSKAFEECRNLESVVINDMNTSYSGSVTRSIGDRAFYNDWHLTDVTLPEDTNTNSSMEVTIGNYAFYQCTRLKNINFPKALTSIGNYAFYKCGAAKVRDVYGNKYYIDTSKNSVDDVFSTSGSGTSCTFCVKQKGHKYSCLQKGYILNSDALLTSKPTNYIEVYIWYSDDTAVGHADTVKRQDYFGLTSVDLSRNTRLVSMGTNAFEGCANLTSFTFPDSIRELPNNVLKECGAEVKDYNNTSVMQKWVGLTTVKLGNATTSIGNSAFESDYNLAIGTDFFPSTLVTIGNSAFKKCASIGKVVIPANVETIGENAFIQCAFFWDEEKYAYKWGNAGYMVEGTGLTAIDLSSAKKIVTIGKGAFEMTPIKKFALESDTPLLAIKDSTFYGCVYLTSVVLSDYVENVTDQALGACSSLNNVTLPASTILNPKVIMSRGVNEPYTSQFSIKLSVPDKNVTFRVNESDPLDINTMLYNYTSDGYDCSFSNVNVDGISYTWDKDNNQLTTSSSVTSAKLTPHVEPKILRTTGTGTTYTLQSLCFMGIEEAENIPVTVVMSLNLPILSNGIRSLTASVEYNAKVRKVPCESIECDVVYVSYEKKELKNAVNVEPKFNPETTTDIVSWTPDSEDLVVMTVAEDGKSAKFYATGNGYGSTKVTIKAGSVKKEIYVYVCAPSNNLSLDNQKLNIGYLSSDNLIATIKYDSKYADYFAQNPDRVSFVSSDPDVVEIGDIVTTIGDSTSDGNTATVELLAKALGSATITATALGSGKTAKCEVTVVSNDISMNIMDTAAPDVKLGDGSSVSLYNLNKDHMNAIELRDNTGSKAFKYEFTSDKVASNDIEWIIDDEEVAKIVSYSSNDKSFKIEGKHAGTTDITFFPKGFDPSANGITVTVSVTGDVNGISLNNKTVLSGSPQSIISSINNTYNDKVEVGEEIPRITENTVEFASSDTDIATVSNTGVVTVKKPGAVVITCVATASDGTVVKTAICNVTCKIAAEDLTISKVSDKVFTGSSIEPKVTVSSAGKKLVEGVDYSIGYRDNKNVGTATIEVKCKGDYDGTAVVNFAINPRVPSNLAQASGKAKQASIGWIKMDEATGYEISKKSGSSYSKVGTTKSLKFTIKGLKANSTYQYAVRTFTKAGDGKTYYSSYRAVKVLTSTVAPKIKKLKAGKKKMTVTWKKVKGASGYIVYVSKKKKKGYKKAVVVKGGKKTKAVVKKLKKGKKYFFKVKAYRLNGKKKILSAFSKPKMKKAK